MDKSVPARSFVSFLGGVGELILISARRVGGRDEIGAAFVERMTAAEALQPQPEAAARAVDFDGFAHVLRAGGIEPARRGQQRRDQAFVPGEAEDEDFA